MHLKQRAQRFCGDRFGRMLLGRNTNIIHNTLKSFLHWIGFFYWRNLSDQQKTEENTHSPQQAT
jgi:hypothetical protein